MRIILLVVVSSLLTYTTTPTMLTDALERLLSPLKVIKVPVHTLAMIMTLALRFIPVLIEEIERIMNAQKARGADLETGGLIKRAMECRCYTGGEGRTRMKQMKLAARDFVALGVTAALLAAVIVLNHYLGHLI